MKKTIIILLCFLVFSCKKKNVKESIKTTKIELISAIKNKNKVKLSDVATKIQYIPLETDSISLLGRLVSPNKDIQFVDGKILVKSDELYLFDKSGAFLNKIGVKGKGPGEYISNESFTTLKRISDTIVAIHSGAQRKTFLYDLKGNYLNDIPVDFWPMYLTSLSDDLVYINLKGFRKQSEYYNLSVISTKTSKLKKRLLYKQNEKEIEKKNKLALDGRISYYTIKDTLTYWERGYDTIWRVSKDLNLLPKYVLDIGKNKMPLEEMVNRNVFNFEKSSKFNSIEKCLESDNYFFIETVFNKRINRIIYNKGTTKGKSTKYKRPFGKGYRFSFYNDIDGGFPFWPQGKVSDNKVFMVVYPYEIKDYIKRLRDNFEAKDLKARNILLKLIENSKISDNPMLMIITLK